MYKLMLLYIFGKLLIFISKNNNNYLLCDKNDNDDVDHITCETMYNNNIKFGIYLLKKYKIVIYV